MSTFDVEREAKRITRFALDTLGGDIMRSSKFWPEVARVLTRCQAATREEVEDEHAVVFCQKCAAGDVPIHSPGNPHWLFMHGGLGCTADWVYEHRRRRQG